jgi:endonuclease YncB( thermonuclease family)
VKAGSTSAGSSLAFAIPIALALVTGQAAGANASLQRAETLICATTEAFHDGDTFHCITAETSQRRIVVRVAGIDAPETGQRFWRAARNRLRELTPQGATLRCDKSDRYQRHVCGVTSPDGQDVGEELLKAGLAWHFKRYASEQTPEQRSRYAEAEASARKGRRGLWAEPGAIAPWDCRAQRRDGRVCREGLPTE